jgi:hypothetical protein
MTVSRKLNATSVTHLEGGGHQRRREAQEEENDPNTEPEQSSTSAEQPPVPEPTNDNHAYPHSSGAMVRYPWLNKELGHEASDAGRSVA